MHLDFEPSRIVCDRDSTAWKGVADRLGLAAHDMLPHRPLHGVLAVQDRTRERFRSSPERRLKATFARERRDDATLRRFPKATEARDTDSTCRCHSVR